MDENPAWSLELSQEELYLLAGFLETPSLIGMDDPFLGKLADEVSSELEQVRKELIARGLLAVEPDGSLSLDPAVCLLVNTITKTRHVLMAVRRSGYEDQDLRLLHVADNLVVEQRTLRDRRVMLSALRDQAHLAQHLKTLFRVETDAQALGPVWDIPEARLTEALRLSHDKGPRAGEAYLQDAGVPAVAMLPLVSALDEGRGVCSLIQACRDPQQIHYGERIAWLTSSRGAWKIEPLPEHAPPLVRMIPVTGTAIEQRMAEIIAMRS